MNPLRAPRASVSLLWLAGVAGCSPPDPPPAPIDAVAPPTLVPPSLPIAIANNAVASIVTPSGQAIFSFLGMESTKRWDGITRAAFRWNQGEANWRRIPPVPGPARLAATAQAVGGRVFLFGGYTVAADGGEKSVADVAVYNPAADAWSSGAPIPIPVDDAVSGVWRDSLIYLVSGWHDTDNEALVQIYDPASDVWHQGTPIPGPPVFGHAGGITGNSIVYVDGTRVEANPRAFVLERSSWLGEIDPTDPTRIEWTRLPDHPGPALYRAAAAGGADRVVFAGGADNPYNYDGNGYDGQPSEPVAISFAWEGATRSWVELPPPEPATMDHRGLVEIGGRYFTVGGITSDRRVTARVHALP